MDKFNNQFATQKLRQETSMTSGGAGMTPSTVNNPTNQDWYTTKNKKKVKKEEKDVEPKLAAGKAKVYMKDKWGWKEAPSISNRPSKGGFMYSQIFEDTLEERSINENLEPGDRVKVVYGNEFYGETGTIDDIVRGFVTVEMDSDGRIYSMHSSDVEKIDDEEDDYDYNQIDEANSATTNSEELVRVKALLAKARETKNYSVMTAYENRIAVLEKLVNDIEPVLGKQPLLQFSKNAGDYLKSIGYKGKIIQNPTGGIKNLKDIVNSIIGLNEKELSELDINDPILMAMRAKKDAPKTQASKPKSNNNQAKINMLIKKRAEIERDMEQEAEPEGGPIADKYGDMLNRIDKAIAKLKGHGEWGPETNPYMDSAEIRRRAAMIKENYSKFKTETKTRGKSDQFHQAVREVRRKVQEINRLFEYVSRLKLELSEGEGGLKYKMHTEKALAKIKEMVSELNQNIKKFK
jgi:hypothetical protein